MEAKFTISTFGKSVQLVLMTYNELSEEKGRLVMSELKLELAGEFDAVAIRAELSEHLKVSEPRLMFFKSAEPRPLLSSWAMLWLGCHLVRRWRRISLDTGEAGR